MKTTSREFRGIIIHSNHNADPLREAGYFSTARGNHWCQTELQRYQGTSVEMMGWISREPSDSQSFNKKRGTQKHLLGGFEEKIRR